RSDDDGFTWKKIGDPVVGQGRTTADSTFNNEQGNIVADPRTHNVYDIYAAGETGVLKAHTFTPNHIIVSRSTDMGKSWTANVVFTAPAGTSLANIFPSMAVDPVNGNLYAVWSDGHTVSFSSSKDQGNTWSSPIQSVDHRQLRRSSHGSPHTMTLLMLSIMVRTRLRISIQARAGMFTLRNSTELALRKRR